MSTMSARRKAMRGTKRTCQTCEVRFYDLARTPIVCPMCGAHYAPPADAILQAKERSVPFSTKTGWRSQPFKRTQPVLPVADATPMDPGEAVEDDETEETGTEHSEDCVVLEQEPDDGDVLNLVDHNAPDIADH
jgi:uncharacterized protein (TIGR02300 family)